MRPARLVRTLIVGLSLIPLAAAAFTPDVSHLDAVPLALVRAPLAKQIELAADKTEPFQFAVKAPLVLDLRDGLWDLLDLDFARWRLRVRSPGAQSLSFEFARFQLPDAAELRVYDVAGQVVQGPYGAADRTPEGKLWTAMVPGEEAVLELRAPIAAQGAIALALGAVAHGFRGLAGTGAGSSGACNVDVACPQGDAWRDEVRAVALLSIDGSYFCTGEALNNTRQDNTPLLITANHCGIGQNLCGGGHSALCSPSSVVVYWNFQDSRCRPHADRPGPDGSTGQSQSGATILAADVASDFTLLRLNRAPDPAFNVYMAGWNATGSTPQSGAAIHHPSGDEKSISLYSNPARRADTCIDGTVEDCRRDVHAWGVHWSEGTTEQGSSGGGLWDENHRLVGWLSGGKASCDEPGGEDFFARMDAAWTAGPADDQQLEHWLAPDDGAKSVCGRDRSAGSCDPGSATVATVERGGALDPVALLALAAFARRRTRRRIPASIH